jgi:hypothetical protein
MIGHSLCRITVKELGMTLDFWRTIQKFFHRKWGSCKRLEPDNSRTQVRSDVGMDLPVLRAFPERLYVISEYEVEK